MIMKTVAIIPAGGSGRRLGGDVAKQYLLLGGMPVLARTLAVFQKSAVIDGIILVVPAGDLAAVRKQVVEPYDLTKVSAVVAGGKERQDSVRNGLAAVGRPCDVVVVHDGVRPFVTGDMIARAVEAAARGGAAAIGVPAKDTIKAATDAQIVTATLPRQNLWQTQTPQAFQYDLLCRAYDLAARDRFYATDDASLVERLGASVRLLAGTYDNIKITTPEDRVIAEAFLVQQEKNKMTFLCGLGYDSHRFAPGRKLVLGGVDIPFERGLAGHSDADALVHAVCDALLGMAAAGDIGRHFPDTDPAYRDISSLLLLERVGKMLADRNIAIHHIDATVMTEKPKLSPYAPLMAANIAKTLRMPQSAVNIKAKTNEGMGFVGRGEGVAVEAVATGAERDENG
jgi:2-C-methyl-D-erythritol 4-phosphate cytidylyltransferase/2-C-methyl-D-erythritol 2,4-cyclodiphosphate synthase